ncbi:MAG TPA: YbjN domain-containing protein [Micromonosporaceae bacterium]|nr:YbjN domain-containing protein [Micromonosporaceae bacterium]
MVTRAEVGALIEAVCAARELPCERTAQWSYAVTLPGSHKLKTVCNLIVGEHALRIEAFVMRQPDERREELWAWLLQRNARMYGVAFAIDANGDVYLTGRVSLHAVTEEELDRLLGAVLTYADESFDTMLEIGFSSAIRREWAWRASRGESLEHLRAFRHLVEPDDD